MWIYLVVAAATAVAACFVKNQYEARQSNLERQKMLNRVFVVFIFGMLFILAAMRINVGNDYTEYVEIFQKIAKKQQVSTEVGFNAIVRVFQLFFGVDTYLPIFAFFSAVTIFFMLKFLYDQSENFAYAFFLFLCSGYYFSSLNTVRYYLAFAIALYAAKYVIKRDYLRFILWIIAASSIHKTVLIVIPIYLFAARKWKKVELILVGAVTASLLVFPEFYRKIIFMIYPYYENSAFDVSNISYMNILKCVAVLGFALLYYKLAMKDNRQNLFYFYLNLGALLLYSAGSFIPEISRLGYYMIGFQTVLLPNVIAQIKNKKQKYIFGILIALAFFAYFAIFMKRAGGVELRIVPYKTWLFHELTW